MKRLFFILSILFAVSSCFGDDFMTEKSYTLCADFEYQGVDYDAEFGADSVFLDIEGGIGFRYSDLIFYHDVDTLSGRFNGGFAMSYLDIPKSGVTDGLDNMFRVNTPKGAIRNTFLVFHDNADETLMPKNDVEFMWTDLGTCSMSGCYVNNTVMVADSIKANFEKGDRFLVRATGWLNGAKTGEAEVVLADFSSQKDSIVSTWTQFDLSKLGSVQYVDFEVVTDKADKVPAYFCMDYMIASVDIAY